MDDMKCTETILDELHSMREDLKEISRFISDMKRDYAVMEEKMELNSSDVMRLLGISRASLARWRDSKAVPYRYVSSNHVAYPFKGLYIAVKTGRATFKGFRRVEVLQRLNAYKDGMVKGYMGDSQVLFEEL